MLAAAYPGRTPSGNTWTVNLGLLPVTNASLADHHRHSYNSPRQTEPQVPLCDCDPFRPVLLLSRCNFTLSITVRTPRQRDIDLITHARPGPGSGAMNVSSSMQVVGTTARFTF